MRRATVLRILLASASLALTSAAFARGLTYEDRVAAQEKIERVYYAHQVGAAIPFEEAVPRSFLEAKVTGFLERSLALARFWNTNLDEDALRREWQRIERQTPFPERLREIHAALGNDPLLIAECFVRPLLVQRMASSFFDQDQRIHGEARARAEALRTSEWLAVSAAPEILEYAVRDREDPVSGGSTIELSPDEYAAWRARVGSVEEGPLGFTLRKLLDEDAQGARVAKYFVPKRSWSDWWSGEVRASGVDVRPVETIWHGAGRAEPATIVTPRDPGSCPADDTWDNGPFEDVPDHTTRHVAVWTGSEMLVWGGLSENMRSYPAGWRYDPAIDTWHRINKVGAPTTRADLTAVWTGSEMLVWGGAAIEYFGSSTWMSSGGRYDPATDSWQPISSQNAPTARSRHTAVWTGAKMIVWGGMTPSAPFVSGDGSIYDPVTDEWSPISSVDAPAPRAGHTAVWTGAEMIVWGGSGASSTELNTGARYDPSSDTWTPLTTAGAPIPRAFHSAVWTGTEMIVFGGTDEAGVKLQSGGRWSEAAGWSPTSPTGAPQPRGLHSAVWTGSRMLIWSGGIGGTYENGRAYDPATDQWGPDFSSTNAPAGRLNHSTVWTGDQMIVWGGEVGSPVTHTGGRYDPTTDTWTKTSTGGAAGDVGQFWLGGRSPLWTGRELVFLSYRSPGYAFDPLTGTGRVIPASGRPAGPTGFALPHEVAWTGSEALLWGPDEGAPPISPGHGLRYNPIGDVWTEMPLVDAPYSRYNHSMIWTGSLLLVWGGANPGVTDPTAHGQRFNPQTDAWSFPLSIVNAPNNRFSHCSLWDGDEMIVYGGGGSAQAAMSGGRFHEATNTWSPMTPGPVWALAESCLWTGSELWAMYLGYNPPTPAIARYDPVSDTWTTVPAAPVALGALLSSARAWSGTHLVRWGGQTSSEVYTGIGARFDPTTDSWSVMSQVKAPEPRSPNWSASIGNGYVYVVGGRYGINTDSRDGGRYVTQVDAEGDGVPELCDNCPGLANADQTDADADAHGDACDSCTDVDGDAFGNPGFPANTCALDNCPEDANPSQADLDGDAAGDPCDDCTDTDHDGLGNSGFPGNLCGLDNCAVTFNAVQRDSDADGLGDLCDICPSTADASQADADGDGAGNACDCQSIDPNDRTPSAVPGVTASKPAPGTIALAWGAVVGADAYSITRGDLATVGTGVYGACVAEGVTASSHGDATTLASGQGFAYLVQAQSYDCGLGSLGTDGTEAERVNGAGACVGGPHADSDATGESGVFGVAAGALSNLHASDNLVQTITEEVTSGNPSDRINRLEHRWTFTVGAGSQKQLHVEGFRSTSTDGDNFRFEYSTDGASFTAVTLASLPFADDGIDLVGALPAGLSGTVTIRVVDTDRTPGNQAADSVSLDELFLRAVP